MLFQRNIYLTEKYVYKLSICYFLYSKSYTTPLLINQKSIKYNWHEADVTVLEGFLARGDRRTSRVILEAYRLGALFDAWTEHWDYGRWLKAFENTGVDMDFYTKRVRDEKEIFPWDFIDVGVTTTDLGVIQN